METIPMPRPPFPGLALALPLMAATCHAEGGLTPAEIEYLRHRAQAGMATTLNVDIPEQRVRLEQPSRPIAPDSPGLPALIADMRGTVTAMHGMGLAAVQIGVPVRVALLRREAGGEFQAFLNPRRIAASAQRLGAWERCLSVPWGYRYTDRPAKITLRYQTPDGAEHRETLADGEAVVFQQELDHLDGKLLSSGHDPRWFIPEDGMAGFLAEVGCADLERAACRARTKAHWETRAKAVRP